MQAIMCTPHKFPDRLLFSIKFRSVILWPYFKTMVFCTEHLQHALKEVDVSGIYTMKDMRGLSSSDIKELGLNIGQRNRLFRALASLT